MTFLRMIRLSRPRFWIYEFGTFMLGVLCGVRTLEDLSNPWVIFFGIFFLFPANLLIYGINDIFDYETDRLNPKKTGYEDLLHPKLHSQLFTGIFISNIVFLISGFFIPLQAFYSLLLFYFFAIFYSTPPIRAKARPFFDSLFSASHYVVTGVFGYFLVGGSGSIVLPVLGGLFWAIAMHAYSAVPDIEADQKSGIKTSAIALGKHRTIILCGVLYTLAGIALFPQLSFLGLLLVVPYLALMYLSYGANEKKLFQLYTYFPILNSLVGMILFFTMLFTLL